MPELPDLQVFSRNLEKRLSGKVLEKIDVIVGSKLNVSSKELKDALEDEKLVSIYREGKELHFKFKNGNVLSLHLMLHGNLSIIKKSEKQQHAIIELLFDDDTKFVLADYQGIATPSLNPEKRTAPDALSKEMDHEFLKKALQTKKVIKTLLLDQKIIRGIGNAYADEILWDAGISPFSISNKIPDDKIKALAKSITDVLHNAEKEILKSRPDIISGEVRDFLLIHNSRNKKSPGGAEIQNKPISSRSTYFTDEQTLYK